MAYTETTTQGWGSRIMESIKGILIGIVLFFASFAVLYWNEGRVDMSEVAKTSVEIDSAQVAGTEYDGKLISTTGKLSSEEMLGDIYLKEGKYISLDRIVETYAWKENVKTETKKNTGGSETTTKTYTYEKEWMIDPRDSSEFKEQEGHTNILPSVSGNSTRVSTGTNGVYSLSMNDIMLPGGKELTLSKDTVIEKDGFTYSSGNALYKPVTNGSLTNPVVGDMRITYKVLDHISTATVFGKYMASSSKISAYFDEDNNKLYRVFEGERAGAISTLKTEYTSSLWMLRLIGFAMMYIGINMVFAPLSVFLDVLPFLGSVSRTGVAIVSFIIALVLSIITILISMIIHNVIALVIVILGFAGFMVWYMKKGEKKTETISE